MTEEVANLFRRRTAEAGLSGVFTYVFVDDFLVVVDSRELWRWRAAGCWRIFAELGLEWAPHKRRGPAPRLRSSSFGGFCCNAGPSAIS